MEEEKSGELRLKQQLARAAALPFAVCQKLADIAAGLHCVCVRLLVALQTAVRVEPAPLVIWMLHAKLDCRLFNVRGKHSKKKSSTQSTFGHVANGISLELPPRRVGQPHFSPTIFFSGLKIISHHLLVSLFNSKLKFSVTNKREKDEYSKIH